MSEPSATALTRAFVGVGYVVGARGPELLARGGLHEGARRLAAELESADRTTKAKVLAGAVLEVCRELDRRRVG
jgi:hypothetical protein